MGHYDDAREAHEEYERSRELRNIAHHYHILLTKLSEEDIGLLIESYRSVTSLAIEMSGNRTQHQQLERLCQQIRKLEQK